MNPGLLKVYKYHGNGKDIEIDAMVGYDVVMTTYATVASDVVKKSNLLQQIMWFRIILDEGMESISEVYGLIHADIETLQPMRYAISPHNSFERSIRFTLSDVGASLRPQSRTDWKTWDLSFDFCVSFRLTATLLSEHISQSLC